MGLKKVKNKRCSSGVLSLISNNLSSRGVIISAENSLYECLLHLKMSKGVKGGVLFRRLVRKVRPVVSLKKKKVGGAQYKIPVYLVPYKGNRAAVKWIVNSSCGRKLGSRTECLKNELGAVWVGRGKAVDKKRALYQQALLNRAFIKYL